MITTSALPIRRRIIHSQLPMGKIQSRDSMPPATAVESPTLSWAIPKTASYVTAAVAKSSTALPSSGYRYFTNTTLDFKRIPFGIYTFTAANWIGDGTLQIVKIVSFPSRWAVRTVELPSRTRAGGCGWHLRRCLAALSRVVVCTTNSSILVIYFMDRGASIWMMISPNGQGTKITLLGVIDNYNHSWRCLTWELLQRCAKKKLWKSCKIYLYAEIGSINSNNTLKCGQCKSSWDWDLNRASIQWKSWWLRCVRRRLSNSIAWIIHNMKGRNIRASVLNCNPLVYLWACLVAWFGNCWALCRK